MRTNFVDRATGVLLSCGLLVSQTVSSVYAATASSSIESPPEATNAATLAASDPTGAAMPPVRVRATQEANPDATAQPSQSKSDSVLSGRISTEVEVLSKDILRQEIALERFNLAFRQNAAKQGRWKGWRYFAAQETNSACTEAGLIVAVAERGDHVRRKTSTKNSKNILTNGGGIPGVVGQIVGGAGSGLEFGINEYHALQAERHGYGSKQARDTVIKMVATIDHNLAERERLIKEQPAADREQAEEQELEGKVLADFRDLAVAEFERYHTSAKKTLAQQNSFYLLDIAKNTSGIIGTFLGIHSVQTGHRSFNLSSGVMVAISGAMIMADPVISRLVGKAAEKADKKNMAAHGLPIIVEKADRLETDFGTMQSFCKNHQVKDRPELCSVATRFDAYVANHDYCVNEIQRVSRELRNGSRTAIQNMGTGAFVGATKLASGVMLIDCGANYLHDGIRTNSLLFVGNTTYLAGTTWALIDNIRIQTQREFKYQKLKRDHKLPGNLIHARLVELDAIQKKI